MMRTYFFPLFAVVFTMFASPVLVQATNWDSAPKDGAWLPPVISLLLALLVLGANMKNSKRGHQD